MESDRQIYLAIAELLRRHAGQSAPPLPKGAPDDLTRFELRACSQNGEDGVLAEILQRIGIHNQWFVEFGIEKGNEGNCVFLADLLGWSGLFLEADPAYHATVNRKYRANPRVNTLNATVTVENVEGIFAQSALPRVFDVLSIDIDGNDYWIWKAIERYEPRVVVIEYNSALDPTQRLVQSYDPQWTWGGTDSYGASIAALRTLGSKKGYRLVHTELTGVNALFVKEDLCKRLPGLDAVPIRQPNLFFSGTGHPPDQTAMRYIEV